MMSSAYVVSVPDERLRTALGEIDPRVEVIVWDMKQDAPRDRIDIVVPSYLDGTRLFSRLRGVKTWLVQSQSIGYDGVQEALPEGHVYANAASVHETSTAELTLALILASQRGVDDFVRAASAGHWAPRWHESLADRNVLLVGYGGVGAAIEARLVPFEVRIVRVASHERVDERGRIYGPSSLEDLLADADIVVVVVPLTEDTEHLIDDRFLSRMRDGSLLVNVSRGRVADAQAILRHARTGRLRFALDVTDPEPLPDSHELFTLTNVLISPHIGGATSAMLPRMARLLRTQIDLMLAGDAPVNVVLHS